MNLMNFFDFQIFLRFILQMFILTNFILNIFVNKVVNNIFLKYYGISY